MALWARYLERCHLCDATRNPFEVRSGQMFRNLFCFVYSVTKRIILLLRITPCFIQNLFKIVKKKNYKKFICLWYLSVYKEDFAGIFFNFSLEILLAGTTLFTRYLIHGERVKRCALFIYYNGHVVQIILRVMLRAARCVITANSNYSGKLITCYSRQWLNSIFLRWFTFSSEKKKKKKRQINIFRWKFCIKFV